MAHFGDDLEPVEPAPLPGGSVDLHGTLPEPTAPARPRVGRVAAVIASVMVVVAGGVFAVSQAASSGAPSTPDAAVRQMLDSLSRTDLLGAIRDLPPSEAGPFSSSATEIASQLERLGILAQGTNLSDLPGVSISFDDVTTSTTQLSDDVADVRFTGGTVHTTADPAELPYGTALATTVLRGKRFPPSKQKTVPIAGTSDFVVATVKDGGSWHVSLLYTIAENLRLRAHRGAPNFGQGVPAVGAATPEAAVQTLVSAAASLDFRRVVELTSPDTDAVLHDYAPLLLPAVEVATAAANLKGISIDVSNLGLHSVTSGDTARVTLTGVTIKVHGLDGNPTLTYNGRCFTEAGSTGTVSTCDKSFASGGEGISGLFPLMESSAPLGISVEKVGGSWYFDPVASILDQMVLGLQALAPGTVQTLLSRVNQAVTFRGSSVATEAPGGMMRCSVFAYGSSVSTPPSTVGQPSGSCVQGNEVPLPLRVPACFPPLTAAPTVAQAHAAEVARRAATAACLRAEIASGQLPAADVPSFYLTPTG